MYKEIKHNKFHTFQLEGEPELIHIIKTGFENKYIIVHEDASEQNIGSTEIKTREEIQEDYGISLHD